MIVLNDFGFLEKALLEKSLAIILVQTVDDNGQEYYAYLAIKPLDIIKLKDAISKDGADIRQFGKIISQGKGKPASQDIQKMHEQYGFSEIFSVNLS